MTLKKAYYGDYEEKMRKRKAVIAVVCVAVILVIVIIAALCLKSGRSSSENTSETSSESQISLPEETTEDAPDAETFSVPAFSGLFSIEINGNVPFFSVTDFPEESFEYYSPLDKLGRCGPASACLGIETMPTEERGSIGMIKPSGWHTIRYDDLIEDKYLYNRCHLIAYSLSGENANELNLITGTRYLNVSGMLPYENMTAEYIEKTGNHVLYRVTPVFEGDNLVATGVLMEAQSLEDKGTGLMFNVFIYNIQPGIVIDYSSGESHAE